MVPRKFADSKTHFLQVGVALACLTQLIQLKLQILIYLQLDSNHIIVPNVFVYVIPEHTNRADCSVNNNNNNNNTPL